MRCQFCNYDFTTAGHYGRHLHANHHGKELGSNCLQKPPPPELQSVPRNLKCRHLNNLRATNASPQQDLDDNHNLNSIETPGSRRATVGPDSPAASLEHHLPHSLMVGQAIRRSLFTHIRSPSWNPLSPFMTAYEYKLAHFFHQSKTSMKQIDQFFHNELLPRDTFQSLRVEHKSSHTWRNKMRGLVDEPEWQNGTMDFHLQRGIKFFYRDVVECIHYLLRQKAFAQDLIFEPSREFDSQGCRVYTEMHTTDWWWEMQVCFPNHSYS